MTTQAMVALKAAEVDTFLARPDAARPVVLIYGADAGLVRERAEKLIRASVDDPKDPFALAQLEGDMLASEPARLAEEAHTVPLFGGDGWEAPELLQIAGAQALEGTYYSTHFSPESTDPLAQRFVAAYKAKYNGETPDAMAALGYDSAMVLADAIRRAGTTEGPKLREALAATKDFPGATGITTLDAKRDASKPAVIITVKNGQFHYLETIAP